MAGSRPHWSELARLQERLNRLIEQALTGVDPDLEGGLGNGWRPPVDLVETADAFVVYLEIPGVRREDLRVDAGAGWLEISGHREVCAPESSFLRLEGSYGPFRRRIELPMEIDGGSVAARLERGLLEIKVPKAEGSHRAHVEIREG